MQYEQFIIKKYRAVTEEICIPISKNSLIPIIGINECGKTTILQAIFSFDHTNDNFNNGKHLNDTDNLYSTDTTPAIVGATIKLTWPELKEFFNESDNPPATVNSASTLKKYAGRVKKHFKGTINLFRNLSEKKYSIDNPGFDDVALNNTIGSWLIMKLPYILYFDDFIDLMDNKIKIDHNLKESNTGWLAIIEELFYKTDKNFSVFELKGKDERKSRQL
jgi:hypothetical protein